MAANFSDNKYQSRMAANIAMTKAEITDKFREIIENIYGRIGL